MKLRLYQVLAGLVGFGALCPAMASQYNVTILTTYLEGMSGSLVFDWVSDTTATNTVTVRDFFHDGTTDTPGTSGGPVAGDILLELNPAPVTTIQDGDFLNQLSVPFTNFGTSITFTLEVSENAPATGGFPDEFTLYLLDDNGLPRTATLDPTGADAFFALDVDGSSSGMLQVFAPTLLNGEEIIIPSPMMLDIDGNGAVDALTDGRLLSRYLFGLRGTALTGTVSTDDYAIGPGASRTTGLEIGDYISTAGNLYDIDENQALDTLSDGLLVLRYLLNFRDDALIAGAVAPDGSRKTSEEIEAYLDTLR